MNATAPAEATRTLEVCLAEIENSAIDMRNALMSRNEEEIMHEVSGQERLLAEFSTLWRSDPKALNEAIRQTVVRIRSLMKRNAVMAKTFLDLVGGTVESLNARAGRQVCDYDATGRVHRQDSPILVQYQG